MRTHTLCDDFQTMLESNDASDTILDSSKPSFEFSNMCTEVVAYMRRKGFERGQGEILNTLVL